MEEMTMEKFYLRKDVDVAFMCELLNRFAFDFYVKTDSVEFETNDFVRSDPKGNKISFSIGDGGHVDILIKGKFDSSFYDDSAFSFFTKNNDEVTFQIPKERERDDFVNYIDEKGYGFYF